MSIIDYKIVRLSHEGRYVKIKVRVYAGSFGAVKEIEPDTGLKKTTNKYVRSKKIQDFELEYYVPENMSRQEFIKTAQIFLNERLIAFAGKKGYVVIDQQKDVLNKKQMLAVKETTIWKAL